MMEIIPADAAVMATMNVATDAAKSLTRVSFDGSLSTVLSHP
jgi:hypothetical protein